MALLSSSAFNRSRRCCAADCVTFAAASLVAGPCSQFGVVECVETGFRGFLFVDMPDRAAEAAIAQLNNTPGLGSRNINVRECTPQGYQAALRKKQGLPPPHDAGNPPRRRSRSRSPRGDLQRRRSRSRSYSPRRHDAATRRREYSPPPRHENARGLERDTALPSRHLFVGNIPLAADEQGMSEYFSRFGRVQSVKILPKKGPMLTAFVDFFEQDDAMDAHESEHKFDGVLLRTDYNSSQRGATGPSRDYHDRPTESSVPRTFRADRPAPASAQSGDRVQHRASPPRYNDSGSSQTDYSRDRRDGDRGGSGPLSRMPPRQHESRDWTDASTVTRQSSGSISTHSSEINGPAAERRASSGHAELGAALQQPAQQHPDAKLFVGNLTRDCSASDLRHAFGEFGAINEAKVLQDTTTGNSRGFGFVHMVDPGDAQRAIAQLHGTECNLARYKGLIVRVAENKRGARGAGQQQGDTGAQSGQQQQQQPSPQPQMEYASRRDPDSWGQQAQPERDSDRLTSFHRGGLSGLGDQESGRRAVATSGRDRGITRKRSRSRSPVRRDSFEYNRDGSGNIPEHWDGSVNIDHGRQSHNDRRRDDHDSYYEPARHKPRVETHVGDRAADDRRRDGFDDRRSSAHEVVRGSGSGGGGDRGDRFYNDRDRDANGRQQPQQQPQQQQQQRQQQPYAGDRGARDGDGGQWSDRNRHEPPSSAQRRGAPPPGHTYNTEGELRGTAGPPGISRTPRAPTGGR